MLDMMNPHFLLQKWPVTSPFRVTGNRSIPQSQQAEPQAVEIPRQERGRCDIVLDRILVNSVIEIINSAI